MFWYQTLKREKVKPDVYMAFQTNCLAGELFFSLTVWLLLPQDPSTVATCGVPTYMLGTTVALLLPSWVFVSFIFSHFFECFSRFLCAALRYTWLLPCACNLLNFLWATQSKYSLPTVRKSLDFKFPHPCKKLLFNITLKRHSSIHHAGDWNVSIFDKLVRLESFQRGWKI